jgi:hypothetical protein
MTDISSPPRRALGIGLDLAEHAPLKSSSAHQGARFLNLPGLDH